MSVQTKECTEVYFDSPSPQDILSFEKRRGPLANRFSQKVFKSQDRFETDKVMEVIQHLKTNYAKSCPATTLLSELRHGNREMDQEDTESLGSASRTQPWPATDWAALSKKDKVNRKRELVKACILKQAVPNLRAAARFANAHVSVAKRVFDELNLFGDITSYQYNNVKSQEETTALEEDISRIEDGFMTVADLKRRHPSFSRKAILKHLHAQGYRYRLLPKNMRNPEQRIINSTSVCRLISHMTQAITDPNTTILYIDEMKFPLYQTSERRWQHPDSALQDSIIYNRRTAHDRSLTAIALCSLEKFEAVQIFEREINGDDFLYFLNAAIAHLPAGRHYTIIADNATWHNSEAVRRSKASDYLYFNEPRMFQLNIIENAFSFVRCGFRKRPIVVTVEEEAKNILRIFFDPVNKKRFRGLVRNHLRQLEKFLTKHKPH